MTMLPGEIMTTLNHQESVKESSIFSVIIVGIICLALGVGLVYFFGHDIELSCMRSKNQCFIEKTNILGNNKQAISFPLNTLTGAKVSKKRGTGSDREYTYKLIIRTTTDEIPFTDSSSGDYISPNMQAAEVNAYVASKQEELSIEHNSLIVKLVGLLFGGAGLLALVNAFGRMFRSSTKNSRV